jgi:hypothetical protein
VDLTDLVRDTGVEQDPLSRRRLTGVDVSHDPDVAELGKRVVGGSHGIPFLLLVLLYAHMLLVFALSA